MKYYYLLILMVLVVPVMAANQTPIRISQGDTVYLNETVDISGVAGWAEYLAYNGGEPPEDGLTTMATVKTPATKEGYYNYYIDPSIFSSRLGYWYQWYGHYEPGGNLVAFYVSGGTRPSINTTVNATNATVQAGNTTTITIDTTPPTILPEVHVSDYLVASGDPFTIDTPNGGHVWLFGTGSSLYDVATIKDNLTVTAAQTAALAPGDYTLLIQTPGKNGEYDVRYYNNSLQYKDAWNGIQSVSINGIQPLLVVGKLQEVIARTDDSYVIMKLTVQYPKITINSMYEVNHPPQEDFIFDTTGTITWFDVRGYTNLANGTTVKACLDRSQQVKPKMYSTTVVRSAPGNMSQYEAFVPIDWDKISVGMHTITVESADGAITYADFPVTVMPANSYRPNATLKYAGDRNPYVPPTFINTTVTVIQTQEVVKEVRVEVTPAPEVIEAAQKKVVNETVRFYGEILITAVIICLLGAYMFSVYRRARR